MPGKNPVPPGGETPQVAVSRAHGRLDMITRLTELVKDPHNPNRFVHSQHLTLAERAQRIYEDKELAEGRQPITRNTRAQHASKPGIIPTKPSQVSQGRRPAILDRLGARVSPATASTTTQALFSTAREHGGLPETIPITIGTGHSVVDARREGSVWTACQGIAVLTESGWRDVIVSIHIVDGMARPQSALRSEPAPHPQPSKDPRAELSAALDRMINPGGRPLSYTERREHQPSRTRSRGGSSSSSETVLQSSSEFILGAPMRYRGASSRSRSHRPAPSDSRSSSGARDSKSSQDSTSSWKHDKFFLGSIGLRPDAHKGDRRRSSEGDATTGSRYRPYYGERRRRAEEKVVQASRHHSRHDGRRDRNSGRREHDDVEMRSRSSRPDYWRHNEPQGDVVMQSPVRLAPIGHYPRYSGDSGDISMESPCRPTREPRGATSSSAITSPTAAGKVHPSRAGLVPGTFRTDSQSKPRIQGSSRGESSASEFGERTGSQIVNGLASPVASQSLSSPKSPSSLGDLTTIEEGEVLEELEECPPMEDMIKSAQPVGKRKRSETPEVALLKTAENDRVGEKRLIVKKSRRCVN